MVEHLEIFISYAWGGNSEEFVNRLDAAFQVKGIKIIRDKRDLGYKGLIKEFMERIGRGKCVIAVINDKYLKSSNCMFELIEFSKNGEFYDRIFPIVLTDAQIYRPTERIKYIKYWEDEINELDKAMRSMDNLGNLQGFREEIDQYIEIRQTISKLTDILKNMNTLTSEIHSQSNFEILLNAVNSKLTEESQYTKSTDENVRKDNEKAVLARYALSQVMTMVFVDLMRLLYVAFSNAGRAANSERYPEFVDIAEQHFTDLRSHIARFSIDLDTHLHELSLQIERRLSFILGRVKRESNLPVDNNDYFNKMQQIGQKLHNFCMTAMGEKYEYIVDQVDTKLSHAIENSNITIRATSLDDVLKLRLYVQSQLLEGNVNADGAKISTIADDMDLDYGIYYFVLDQKLLDLRFPASN